MYYHSLESMSVLGLGMQKGGKVVNYENKQKRKSSRPMLAVPRQTLSGENRVSAIGLRVF